MNYLDCRTQEIGRCQGSRRDSQQKRSFLRDVSRLRFTNLQVAVHPAVPVESPQLISFAAVAHHCRDIEREREREATEAGESIGRAIPSSSGSGTPGSPIELVASDSARRPMQQARTRYTAQELVTLDGDYQGPKVRFQRGVKHPRLASGSSLRETRRRKEFSSSQEAVPFQTATL